MASRVAGAELARYPGYDGLRCRQAVARPAEEGPRVDSLYRRATLGAGIRRINTTRDQAGPQSQDDAKLYGYLYRCPQVCNDHLCHHTKPADETAGVEVHEQYAVPRVSGQTPAEGITIGKVCRPRHCRHFGVADETAGHNATAICRSENYGPW